MITEDILARYVPDTADELRFRVTLLLAQNYMTTSTATIDASVQLDATNDVKRLKAAVDAVISILPKVP